MKHSRWAEVEFGSTTSARAVLPKLDCIFAGNTSDRWKHLFELCLSGFVGGGGGGGAVLRSRGRLLKRGRGPDQHSDISAIVYLTYVSLL